MRILVTGATGFVGKALVDALAQSGHELLLPLRGDFIPKPHCEVVRIDAIEEVSMAQWQQMLLGCDAVVHSAGLAHIGLPLPEERYMAVNCEASVRLAQAAALQGVTRFVYLSSIRAQVGAVSSAVQSEATQPAPTEAYGRSKRAGELGVRAALPSATILRPALVIGSPPKANLKRMAQLARLPIPLPFGAFTQLQSVVTLANLVDAIVMALEDHHIAGQLFVVAEERGVSLADMLGWIREGLGRAPNLLNVPPALLKLPFKMINSSDAFDRLNAGLRVDATRFRQAGWRSHQPIEEAFRQLGR